MPDVTLTIDYAEDDREHVRDALRGFEMPDARFLEEGEEEGRDEPVLRFERGTTAQQALMRAGEIARAAAEVADGVHHRHSGVDRRPSDRARLGPVPASLGHRVLVCRVEHVRVPT